MQTNPDHYRCRFSGSDVPYPHPVLLSLSGTVTHTGVAHAAHLGGLVFGFLYYRNSWRLLPYWDRTSQFFQGLSTGRRQSKLRVNNNDIGDSVYAGAPTSQRQTSQRQKTKADERFDEQLDEVLQKITESGQESLTDREKKILTLGSQRYRNQ